MTLEEYRQKRDFRDTKEPEGGNGLLTGQNRFVIQEHHASHLHYDFRVELDGVLKSWAVPKGFPATTGVRRLAIMTEDHPVEYLTFAGNIPQGNYGAGEMSIWDTGIYTWVGNGDLALGIERGKLELILHGERLTGQFDMIRTDETKKEWILIKVRQKSPQSLAKPDIAVRRATKAPIHSAKKSTLPAIHDLSPMLAESIDNPFDSSEWQFEIKWDGYRAFYKIEAQVAQLVSRNHIDLSKSFSDLLEDCDRFSLNECIIDGEIVALTPDGKPDFQALQKRVNFAPTGNGRRPTAVTELPTIKTQKTTIIFMAFDILYAEGWDLRDCSLAERRAFLRRSLDDGGSIRYSDSVEAKGTALFDQVRELGIEGIMAKKIDSKYVMGRSSSWKKLRITHNDDFVIGGFTESKSVSRAFGSLILGKFDGEKLQYFGHVGTGFNDDLLHSVHNALLTLTTPLCPFSKRPVVNGTPTWVKPEIVCEVKFSDVTVDGMLRHPVFVHLRPDKMARECVIVEPQISQEPDMKLSKSVPKVLMEGSTVIDSALTIHSNTLNVTHLDKVYWPRSRTTKRDLLRYYATVSEVLLPHLYDRPLVIQRFPNGVESTGFFQHDITAHGGSTHSSIPSYLKTFAVRESSGVVHYTLCNNTESLIYLANLGGIPLHSWNVMAGNPEHPDRMVFDFDPGVDFSTAIDGALCLKSVLDSLGLASYPKTSGANGIHVYVPIDPIVKAQDVIAFAKEIAKRAQLKNPKIITTERRIKSRDSGQVYLDAVQNGVGKTVVAPYSVRAEATPNVSAPLKWSEVAQGLKIADFTINTIVDRINALGDLFAPVLNNKQSIVAAKNVIEERR